MIRHHRGHGRIESRLLVIAMVLLGVVSMVDIAFPEEPNNEEARNIEDNSFLLEEAYNQEYGVVQHIQALQYMRDATWVYTFVQEWPVPNQTHQLSYNIPYLRVRGDTQTTSGFGDIQLNYRYQAIMKDNIAMAPRFSLILPTGNYKRELGNGALGFQANIPLSVKLSKRFVTHWNLGGTYTPRAKGPDGSRADLASLNYGASIIWLARENFNVLLEAAGASTQTVTFDGVQGREKSFFINPGIRFAVNCKSGLQIVPGLGFPIGVGPSARQYGAFLYLSFEHPVF